MTSTNNILFPSNNGTLTFEYFFFTSYICKHAAGAGFRKRSYRTKELMQTFDEAQNNYRKHAQRSNNRVSMPTRVLGRVRNDSNVRRILRTRMCFLDGYISVTSVSFITVIYPSRYHTAASF